MCFRECILCVILGVSEMVSFCSFLYLSMAGMLCTIIPRGSNSVLSLIHCATTSHALGHPYIVSLLVMASLYPHFLISRNFFVIVAEIGPDVPENFFGSVSYLLVIIIICVLCQISAQK